MTGRTLPREPWRGSQICGWQVAFGDWTHAPAFCGERKAPGLPYCAEHNADAFAEYGEARMAPGNAVGAPHWTLRLLWEGDDPAVPVEPTGEETAAYAALYGRVR